MPICELLVRATDDKFLRDVAMGIHTLIIVLARYIIVSFLLYEVFYTAEESD